MKKPLIFCLLLVLVITMLLATQGMAEPIAEGKALLSIFMSTDEILSSDHNIFEWEYRSKNGKVVKYYASNLKQIDGLKRTKNRRLVEGTGGRSLVSSANLGNYSFEGDYRYLYLNKEEHWLRPMPYKGQYLLIDGVQWQRSIYITQISDEGMQLLNETNTYRLTDNLSLLRAVMGSNVFYSNIEGYCGARILKPTSLSDESLAVEAELLPKPATWTDKYEPYKKNLNGYLIMADEVATGTNYHEMDDIQKVQVLERKPQGKIMEGLPVINEENAAKTLSLFQLTDADFTDLFFSNPAYENEYVSDDGTISRYYVSLLKEIDGLRRTANRREISNDNLYIKANEYAFQGDYVYLYFKEGGLLRPIYSDQLSVDIGSDEWRRTVFITSINQEALELLNETDTYRVVDNTFLLSRLFKQRKQYGLAILEPKQVEDDYVITKLWGIFDENALFKEEYNGFLIKLSIAAGSENPQNLPTEDRIEILKRYTN